MTIQMNADLRYVFEALPSFGTRYSGLVLGYVSLFGVTPFHIKAKKLRLLIEEMKRLFDAQSFSYQKKLYPISHAGIAEALDVCVKKNFVERLENHNYLKKIMIGISERETKGKARQEGKSLQEKETRLMTDGSVVVDGETLSPARIKSNLTKVGEIIKSIGGK